MPPEVDTFRALFEAAPDAIVVVDSQGRMVLLNPNAERLFGFAPGELQGQLVEVLVPDALHAAHRRHREAYMATARVRPMGAGQELTGRRRDGSEFPVEIALSPIATRAGALFAASIRDVSDTHRARQALERTRYDSCVAEIGKLALETTVEATLESIPAILTAALRVDSMLVVLGAGSRADMQVRAACGLEPEEIEPLLEVVEAQAFRDAAATPGTPVVLDLSNLHGPGADFGTALAVPLSGIDRSWGWVVALSRIPRFFDRGATHFLQSVANLLAGALQRRRTEEQLAHAQRLEAVGQLTGGIAHDFNNLLTVVSGNLQLLEDETGHTAAARDAIGGALRAVGRGAELTRKLLAFARRQRLSPSPLDPAELLQDLGRMLSRTLGEQVDLEIACAAGTPRVFADPAQLDSALINLALNARDAMPRGGRLRIAARDVNSADRTFGGGLRTGDYVVFEISDTGSGMTADVLNRAFEPFFTTKQPGKGSGLGLSMVYGFVRQSGGHLHTESRPMQGTRFTLFLPRAQHDEVKQNGAAAVPVKRGDETVLVVEDEPEVNAIARAFLRALGYSVLSAIDCDQAECVLAANPQITLLFTDVVLGTGRTGVELARSARRSRPELAVLLTSGYERPATQDTEQTGSEFELLRKPYRREDLAAAARRALDARVDDD